METDAVRDQIVGAAALAKVLYEADPSRGILTWEEVLKQRGGRGHIAMAEAAIRALAPSVAPAREDDEARVRALAIDLVGSSMNSPDVEATIRRAFAVERAAALERAAQVADVLIDKGSGHFYDCQRNGRPIDNDLCSRACKLIRALIPAPERADG